MPLRACLRRRNRATADLGRLAGERGAPDSLGAEQSIRRTGGTMNELKNESSPYLLQHADNPVDWWPWRDEAFEKAKAEDKPVFLCIGYSTCHWCHVMAHESFEDAEVAGLLNEHFVCVKVDKEERPDIDSVYMDVCMALTGSGGWPLTIIMDHTGKPFFAGTYFPKKQRFGMNGLIEILHAVIEKWNNARGELLESANAIAAYVGTRRDPAAGEPSEPERLIHRAVEQLKAAFDPRYGGFGRAPKFPTPHNLLFLMEYYEAAGDRRCLEMAEKTLVQMAKGGIFDHIGFGFSRYSTDERWLVPHFEKMLYDNALLVTAYTKAYALTKDETYRSVAEKTIEYIRREMTHAQGGFYAAQDADSDGVEGKYYVFTPPEIMAVLGEAEGREFCRIYDITDAGNFEGASIPNQIAQAKLSAQMEDAMPKLYAYRTARASLHKDDKILTAWNALMIAALADASLAFGQEVYLERAKLAAEFIETHLRDGERLLASCRDGKRSNTGFIDDYAFYTLALLKLYDATLDGAYLKKAEALAQRAIDEFFDHQRGGFYLYGNREKALVARPKEIYDGAMPSGNSVMTMNLLVLSSLAENAAIEQALDLQVGFMSAQATASGGNSFFLSSLLKREFPIRRITAVLSDAAEMDGIRRALRGKGQVTILEQETGEYRLLGGKTTYYVCDNNVCHPPTNALE